MLGVLIVLVATMVAGIVWLANKGLEWWWIALGSVVIFIFILFSYFAYRKVSIERDDYKSNAGKISSLVDTAMFAFTNVW